MSLPGHHWAPGQASCSCPSLRAHTVWFKQQTTLTGASMTYLYCLNYCSLMRDMQLFPDETRGHNALQGQGKGGGRTGTQAHVPAAPSPHSQLRSSEKSQKWALPQKHQESLGRRVTKGNEDKPCTPVLPSAPWPCAPTLSGAEELCASHPCPRWRRSWCWGAL